MSLASEPGGDVAVNKYYRINAVESDGRLEHDVGHAAGLEVECQSRVSPS